MSKHRQGIETMPVAVQPPFAKLESAVNVLFLTKKVRLQPIRAWNQQASASSA